MTKSQLHNWVTIRTAWHKWLFTVKEHVHCIEIVTWFLLFSYLSSWKHNSLTRMTPHTTPSFTTCTRDRLVSWLLPSWHPYQPSRDCSWQRLLDLEAWLWLARRRQPSNRPRPSEDFLHWHLWDAKADWEYHLLLPLFLPLSLQFTAALWTQKYR